MRLYTNVNIIHNNQKVKQPKAPLTDECLQCDRYIHKMNEVSDTWMNSGNMLSEINQTQKDKYCI